MSLINNKKKLLFLIGILLIIPLFLLAQEVPLEVAYPELGDGVQPGEGGGLIAYINYVYNFLLFLGGLIIFGVLIYGGYLYFMSGANASKKKKAKKVIFAAFLGVILSFSAHLILNTINPEITNINVSQLSNIPGEDLKDSSSDFKKSDLKAHAMPLDSAIEELIGKDDFLPRVKKLITEDLKKHINATFTVEKEIAGQEHRHGIASFGEYNHYLTTHCSCQNLEGQCGPPSASSLCGEPKEKNCKAVEGFKGDDGEPDPCPEDIREEINNKLIDLANFVKNEGAPNSEDFTEFETDLKTLYGRIEQEKALLQRKLSAFETLEYSLTTAEWQKNIDTSSTFLKRLNLMLNPEKKSSADNIVSTYESKRQIIEIVPSVLSDVKFSPLTFYELFYDEIEPPFQKKLLAETLPSQILRIEHFSILNKIEIGELMDKVRENSIVMLGKMEKISNLIEEMEGQIADISEGLSQCNDSDCDVTCTCIPNPLAFFGGPPCIQCLGGCNGQACSGAQADLIEVTKELDKTEDLLLKTINDFKMAADKSPLYLENTEDSPFETLNLKDVKNKTIQCQSKKGWDLISCEKALDNPLVSEGGKVITSCHPRDYFCAETKRVVDMEKPSFLKLYDPGYLSDYSTSSENGCPSDWECSQEIKDNQQYQDASAPLQRFLTCFREKINRKKEENEIEDTIITIINISDPNLYKEGASCSWKDGGEDCSYPFTQELFKERVSAHYGGERCHLHIKKSYAVQFKYDPFYIDILIKAANECLAPVNVNSSPPYLDISIAGAYRCGVE